MKAKLTNRINSKLNNRINSKLAFSLIEISVVILVIGILIAGISKGMDLYQDFKLLTARSLTMNSRVGRIPGLTVWLETTSEKSFSKAVPSDNSLIEIWRDINPQRIEKIDASQSDNNLKPRYIKQSINNLPALKFENFQLLSTIPISYQNFVQSDKATIFQVINTTYINSGARTIAWIGTGRLVTNFPWYGYVLFSFGKNCCGPAMRISYALNLDNANKNTILTFIKNTNYSEIKINSLSVSSSNSATENLNQSNEVVPLSIGFVSADPNLPSQGYLGELIIFDRALTNNETKDVETYLSQKWGIKLE